MRACCVCVERERGRERNIGGEEREREREDERERERDVLMQKKTQKHIDMYYAPKMVNTHSHTRLYTHTESIFFDFSGR